MQLSRDGVATGLLGIPNRYMHTPVEVISLKDIHLAGRLVAELPFLWLRPYERALDPPRGERQQSRRRVGEGEQAV